MNALAAQGEGSGQIVEQFLGQRLRRFGIIEPGHQQGEFVAADPCDGIGLADAGAQPFAHRCQQLIACAMPQGIVDRLETVQIDEHERQQLLGAVGL